MSSSTVGIRRSYVLTSLPRPLDHTGGKVTARPVFGLKKDGTKRQRAEVVVGIDGEAANIYDISTSRLVTSYPIPPQESFACPPCSLRVRSARDKTVYRYTFIATSSSAAAASITLFKDAVDASGKTVSTVAQHTLPPSSAKLIHIELSCSGREPRVSCLLAVTVAGDVICLDAETLVPAWTESSKVLLFDLVGEKLDGHEVEFATSSGMGTKDVLRMGSDNLAPGTDAGGSADGSDVVILVSKSKACGGGREKRFVSLLRADTSAGAASVTGQRLVPLQIAPLPAASRPAGARSVCCRVDFSTSQLFELCGNRLSVYSLSTTLPRLVHECVLADAHTFIPLSAQSVFTCSPTAAGIHNVTYDWAQARASFGSAEDKTQKPCSVVAYFRMLDLVVALIGSELVAVPIEPPKRGGKKRRLDGRLIDAVGHGAPHEILLPPRGGAAEPEREHDAAGIVAETRHADGLMAQGKLFEFERFVASKFGIKVKPRRQGRDRRDSSRPEAAAAEEAIPEWNWLPDSARYPPVQQQLWLLYAISRAFSASYECTGHDGGSFLRLRLSLPTDNIATYLAVSGNLTPFHLKSGLRGQLGDDTEVPDRDLAAELVRILVEIDPTMAVLTKFVSATRLGAPELLAAIRTIMQSLGLLRQPAAGSKAAEANLLTVGPSDDENSKDDAHVDDAELDRLEDELALTEYYLGEESSARARALDTALAKLGCCPAAATVRALRATFQTRDILCLIHVLRVELVKGAWTTRYVDSAALDEHGTEPPPDGIISLIATLLSRCLDAVGPRAWILHGTGRNGSHATNDGDSSGAVVPGGGGGGGDGIDSGDFFATLRLEVNAALEGIQECVYLSSFMADVVRFGEGALSSDAAEVASLRGAAAGGSHGQAGLVSLPLPLGPAKKMLEVSATRVRSGGEVLARSKRQMHHLKSQKIGPYSLDRLVV